MFAIIKPHLLAGFRKLKGFFRVPPIIKREKNYNGCCTNKKAQLRIVGLSFLVVRLFFVYYVLLICIIQESLMDVKTKALTIVKALTEEKSRIEVKTV